MAWINFGSVSYWIGQHPKLGPLVLPKKDSFESFRGTTVKLFIVNESRFGEFETAVARGRLSATIGDAAARDAARAYIAYLHAKQHDFSKTVQPSISDTFSEIERQTRCFQCRASLNSKINFSCGACGWIICPACGSCGCNYTPRGK